MKNYSRMNVPELQQEEKYIQEKLAETENNASEFRCMLDAIKKELQRRMKPAEEIRISDHALIRYLERAYNLDIDKIRQEILKPSVVTGIKMGASAVTIDGIKFRVKNNTIVTVIET